MSRRILGIDPGLSGGLVLVNSKNIIEFMGVMPTITTKKRMTRTVKGKRKTYDANVRHIDIIELNQMIRGLKATLTRCYIEKVHARPQEGVVSSFRFGEGFGILQALMVAHDIPYTLVTPRGWCKDLHAPFGKDIETKQKSLIVASRIYPTRDFMVKGKRKPHDGLIDASLIAYYGLQQRIDSDE